MTEEVVRGIATVIRFEAKRCIHSRNCVLTRPDVFVPNTPGDWIHPDRATEAEVTELAHLCPSGAIQAERSDGSPLEKAPRVNTVRLRENGPLAVNAPLTVNGAAQGFRLTLCRCGASANKPYCDGSHQAVGFLASGEVPSAPSEALLECNGPLSISPIPDGPLRVTGNLEIVSGTGKTLNRVTQCVLCRCGQSHNKPNCDGSHKAAQFRT
jgi:CDGSH-type Zn-finger protein/uncharacterized Fe-S cluster protein YjdI